MCYIQCLFPEWNVDVEFNREGAYRDGRHRASKTDFEWIIRKPDIIIHKRWPQGPNLALILIKGYWNTDSCQNDREVALSLKQRGYKAQPLKRVHIPKSNGKTRALGIPTLRDRAMQALYLMAVEPVAETKADPNSYGFRPYRSTADAEERCFKVLCNKKSVPVSYTHLTLPTNREV